MNDPTKKLREISARLKQAEQILHASEGKYRQLVENAECIILRIRLDGKITFFNEYAQAFFGLTEREVLGKNIIGTIIPAKNSAGRSNKAWIKELGRHAERYAIYENEMLCKDGRKVWIAWANKVIHHEPRQRPEILCVGHEITEHKRLENELHLLAAAMRDSNDAITVMDLKGNYLSWNLGAQRIYGYSETEAINMNIRRIIPDHKQNEMRLLVQKTIQGEKVEFYETQRLTRDNKVLSISLTATLLKNKNGKPFAITTTERDITERKFLEKEILDITERERELIGQEMHDGMGQVLTGIALLSKGLATKLKRKSSENAKDALTISHLANKAIVQTRDIAKMLYPVDIETGGLMSALQVLAANTRTMMKTACQFRCGKSVSIKNLVEAKQIYRIVQEAITNAVRHGQAKCILINLRLTRKGTVLSIENDGLNFPKLSPSRKGFGLKIMQYRTGLLGGSLDIRRRAKGGTVVTCIFPVGP